MESRKYDRCSLIMMSLSIFTAAAPGFVELEIDTTVQIIGVAVVLAISAIYLKLHSMQTQDKN